MRSIGKTALYILVTLLIALLAGCSPGAPESEAPAEDVGQEAPAAAESPAEETEEAAPEPAVPDPVPEGTALAIYGDGVSGQTNWTLDELQALIDGYREINYSTTNSWPSFSRMIGHGISLPYLLEQAGILGGAQTLFMFAPDGYRAQVTIEQALDARYSFTRHTAEGSSGAEEAGAMIAWAWGEDEAEPGYLRPLFGQLGPGDVNTAVSVKDLYRIEVSTWNAGAWNEPEASIPSDSEVAAGTELLLSHPNLDNIKLYFTTDGSDPDYFSEVYNKSTTYFQPELIGPITIREDVTIKVFTGGLGKADSGILTLTYKVS